MRNQNFQMSQSSSGVKERVIRSQRSWVVANDQVELAITRLGGQMAPVTFFRHSTRPVQPYFISPWQDEGLKIGVPLLVPLRGDFLCLPFGGNAEAFRGERHPAHGECSGSPWRLAGGDARDGTVTLTLQFAPKVRPGTIQRELSLRAGHNAVYSRTVVEGFTGPTPFSHHAILALPERERALLWSCSPFQFGKTYPGLVGAAALGEYQFLAPDAAFRDLARVPTIFRNQAAADCTAFPARPGFTDLVQLCEKPPARRPKTPSWAAAVNTEAEWLWFAFKDPRLMPSRVLWMENRGRHSAPWKGRTTCLGIEDGCMYFDRGLAESCRPNPISRRGIPTCVELRDGAPFEIRYIQGVARVPHGFGRVHEVTFGDGTATFHSRQGCRVTVQVAHEVLFPLRNGRSANLKMPPRKCVRQTSGE
jgi:hypothetical protein